MEDNPMTTTPNLRKASDFIWRSARLLERRRFAHLFLDGRPEDVVAALHPYQNPDGGFGNALEPDVRAPSSQPVPTWTALCILAEVGAFDDAMVTQICDYLLTITTSDGGVPFLLPSARNYPRAPWWETGDNPPASLNPTAAIAALLHKHGVAHAWLDLATDYCWQALDNLTETNAYEMRAILPFLDYVPDREHAERVFARVGTKILEQKLVALTPTTKEETHTPLNFAPHPQSIGHRLFTDEVIETHLDALVAAQQEDGGWPINWYAWTPAAALEWRGCVTIDALVTLRAYERLA
jgi:hypothetical protein